APALDLGTQPTIPVDVDENGIAYCWAHNEGEALDDDESLQGMGDPNYPGDGLSRYEEYRGFMALGQHIRTNPDDDKDLFISDRDDIHGINGNWEDVTASGVTPHCILESEYYPPGEVLGHPEWAYQPGRWVNFNSHAQVHVRNQYALKVIDGGWHASEGGCADVLNAPGPPRDCVLITIYTERIRYVFGASRSTVLWEDEDKAALRSTLAHETGHGMMLTGRGNEGPPGRGRVLCDVLAVGVQQHRALLL
ncbi:MAG: hypothetical protein AB7Y46_04905, partial [Armatimonadota bacterium]